MHDKEIGAVGLMDRLGRFLFGTVWIAFAYFSAPTNLNPAVFVWLPVWVGSYALVTGYAGRCPVYRMLKVGS